MKNFLKRQMASYGLLFTLSLIVVNAQAATEKQGNSSIKSEATYVGAETCAVCHEEKNREYQLSTHARIATSKESEFVANGCEMCHGPGSIHVDEGGGKGTMINPSKNPSICFTCHLDKKAEFSLPYHHPVNEGKMSCSDCHNLHGTDPRPWTSSSMDDVNAVCFKCHKEMRGPFVFEHEAISEGCTTCHKVHGSIHEKMLFIRDINLCLRCHTQTNYPTIGDFNHGVTRFTQGTCFSGGCHTAVHGSNFDDHLRY
jgi:predicted CXXCH cytochrome family protein